MTKSDPKKKIQKISNDHNFVEKKAILKFFSFLTYSEMISCRLKKTVLKNLFWKKSYEILKKIVPSSFPPPVILKCVGYFITPCTGCGVINYTIQIWKYLKSFRYQINVNMHEKCVKRSYHLLSDWFRAFIVFPWLDISGDQFLDWKILIFDDILEITKNQDFIIEKLISWDV